MITTLKGGRPYGEQFLETMEADPRQLAVDFEKCGGLTSRAANLLRAADVVRRIRQDNEA